MTVALSYSCQTHCDGHYNFCPRSPCLKCLLWSHCSLDTIQQWKCIIRNLTLLHTKCLFLICHLEYTYRTCCLHHCKEDSKIHLLSAMAAWHGLQPGWRLGLGPRVVAFGVLCAWAQPKQGLKEVGQLVKLLVVAPLVRTSVCWPAATRTTMLGFSSLYGRGW